MPHVWQAPRAAAAAAAAAINAHAAMPNITASKQHPAICAKGRHNQTQH
jgi:hypothetical protein